MASENGNGYVPLLPPEPGALRIEINYRLDLDTCKIAAPLNMPGHVYAALERAKDLVRQYNENKPKSGLVAPPPGGLPPMPPHP